MFSSGLRQASRRQQNVSQICQFSSSASCPSKIGRNPVSVPPTVQLTQIKPEVAKPSSAVRTQPLGTLNITGPLGSLSLPLPPYLTVTVDDHARKATVSIADPLIRKQREMWGTTRAMIQNHITGVSEGHIAILRLVGVGYRASIEGNGTIVNLKVGFSHPVELKIPEGVKASTPQPTRILLEGTDKEVVKQFAAEIRQWRVPEPYKGKGIFVNDETIKLKNRKIK